MQENTRRRFVTAGSPADAYHWAKMVGLQHSLCPFQKYRNQPYTPTNLISLSHTTHSQNPYLWLVLLKGQQSYFLLLALALCTWLAELLLPRAGYSFSSHPVHLLPGCKWHPSTASPCGAEPPGTQDESPYGPQVPPSPSVPCRVPGVTGDQRYQNSSRLWKVPGAMSPCVSTAAITTVTRGHSPQA